MDLRSSAELIGLRQQREEGSGSQAADCRKNCVNEVRTTAPYKESWQRRDVEVIMSGSRPRRRHCSTNSVSLGGGSKPSDRAQGNVEEKAFHPDSNQQLTHIGATQTPTTH
jgi:hypothetical protein